MFKHRIFKLLILTAILVVPMEAVPQATLSTYSSLGIGDVRELSLINHMGMGGLGLSKGTNFYLNNLNPALLTNNMATVYQAGFIGELKNVRRGSTTDQNGAFNLAYLAMGFPAKAGKWTFSLGLMPYSTVNFNFEEEQVLGGSGASVIKELEGSGGFNQVYFANGFKINERLSVGAKISYLFSSIINETSNRILEEGRISRFGSTFFSRVSISDVMFTGGLAFNQDINENLRLNLGFTYDHELKAGAKKFERIELRDGADNIISVDTLLDNTSGSITIPRNFGFGISLNNKLKWTAGIDIRMQDWGDFSNFEDSDENLDRSLYIKIGTEIIPDINSADNYFERIAYRVGLNYNQTPFVLNNEQIKEFGINFGWSLPVSRFSSLDMAFQYGVRGKNENGLIREEFFRLYFGITFNDRWFVRRKFD